MTETWNGSIVLTVSWTCMGRQYSIVNYMKATVDHSIGATLWCALGVDNNLEKKTLSLP